MFRPFNREFYKFVKRRNYFTANTYTRAHIHIHTHARARGHNTDSNSNSNDYGCFISSINWLRMQYIVEQKRKKCSSIFADRNDTLLLYTLSIRLYVLSISHLSSFISSHSVCFSISENCYELQNIEMNETKQTFVVLFISSLQFEQNVLLFSSSSFSSCIVPRQRFQSKLKKQ